MTMPEKPSPNAGRVHLQWNEGWETWQEVSPQYAGEPGVVTFIRADLVDELVKAAEGFNRGGITLFGNEEDVPITFKGKDFKALRAALTRIKGDGK